MASELATRIPLLQQQQQATSTTITSQQHHPQGQTVPFGCFPAIGQYQTLYPMYPGALQQALVTHPTSLVGFSTSGPIDASTMEQTANATCVSLGSAVSNTMTFPYGGGFRYQIRRPVESWKFVESRKEDGSVLYMCRGCNSNYKHKKSLNKHWKDKHRDVPRPEGVHPDEDEEDGDEDDDYDEDDDDENDAESAQVDINVARGQTEVGNGSEGFSATTNSDSDKENMENIPPKRLTLPASQGGSIATLQSSPIVRSIPLPMEAFHTASPLAPRRLSMPMRRAINRPNNGRRVSMYSRGGRQPLTTVGLNSQSQNVVQKRPNPVQTTSGSDTTSPMNRTLSSGLECSDSQMTCLPLAKRRLTGLGIERPDGQRLMKMESQHESTIMSQSHVHRTPNDSPSLVNEAHPLDLSRLKDIPKGDSISPESSISRDCGVESVTAAAEVIEAAVNEGNTVSTTEVNRSLLTGLLQTALDMLNSLDTGSSKSSIGGSGATSTYLLSRPSASLLFAIGSLLIALVGGENTRHKGVKPPLTRPVSTTAVVNQTASSPVIPREDTLLTASTPRVLPPAPQSVIRHSALERTAESHMAGVDPTSSSSPVEQADGHMLMMEDVAPTEDAPTPTRQFRESSHRQGRGSAYLETSSSIDQGVAGPVSKSSGRRSSTISSSVLTGSSKSHTRNEVDIAVRPAAWSASSEYKEDARAPILDPVSTEGTIVCPVCQFDARWFSELRAHMVNHSEHRMFGCCYCPYRAKWKWDVAKHMRRCPLGRHVAHLSNEALLRIVRYHPPPQGDILYHYFPQNGFPGVGVDRPPTPPLTNMLTDDLGSSRVIPITTTTSTTSSENVQGRSISQGPNRFSLNREPRYVVAEIVPRSSKPLDLPAAVPVAVSMSSKSESDTLEGRVVEDNDDDDDENSPPALIIVDGEPEGTFNVMDEQRWQPKREKPGDLGQPHVSSNFEVSG